MSAREEIAEAVSASFTGVVCTPYYTQATNPGAAFVRLERIDFPNRFGGVAHWNVVVVLPQDLAAAEAYLEEIIPGLLPALSPHLVVTSVAPQRMEFPDVGALPCVFINGHREAD